MVFTNQSIEDMGFSRMPQGKEIAAQFSSLCIYSIAGVSDIDKMPISVSEQIRTSESLKVTIGANIGDACKALTGIDISQEEGEWLKAVKASPPFLFVLTTLPTLSFCENGYWKDEGDLIITHDCFTDTRVDLKCFEKLNTYPFVAFLSILLSTDSIPVSFIKKFRVDFGITSDKKIVKDYKMRSSSIVTRSRLFEASAFLSQIDNALKLYSSFHHRVGYFLHLATHETDNLKKFLYYFFAIEIHTQKHFSLIKEKIIIEKYSDCHPRIGAYIKEVDFSNQEAIDLGRISLRGKFICCALHAWDNVDESDISIFVKLVKARNNLSHGDELEENSLPINSAKCLSFKILNRKP